MSKALSKKEFKSFEINELIQYLNIQEQSNWPNLDTVEIEKCVALYADNPKILELVSDFYLSNDDLDKALYYNTLAENYGAISPEFFKKRADIYASLGQYGLAVDYINKAVIINGNDPDIYLTKGEVYLKLGDSLSALQYKEIAFRYDSSRKDIAFDLAHIYAAANQIEYASMMTELLINQGYRTKELNTLKVGLLRSEDRNEEANQLLGSLLKKGDISSGESLMEYFKKSSNYDSMIYYATMVLNEDSANLNAIEVKAISFDQKGYFASALLYYNQMLAIDSLNEEALEGVRKVNGKIAYLRKLREQREAIPTFDFASPEKKRMN